MAQSPPISPAVATPLAHRKRRHSRLESNSSMIDLIGDDTPSSPVARPKKTNGKTNGNGSHVNIARKLEDDDDLSESDKELFEDILDTAELEPYMAGIIEGEEGLNKQTSARLRARLLRIGPERFIQETLESRQLSPAILGTAFGLDPQFCIQLGEGIFLRVLGAAIVRAYYKRQKLPQYNTIDDAAALLRKSSNIMVITGAGISTSLGIPDFRSKETGFYSKLVEKGFSEPEQVFDIHEFDTDPRTFYELAADILPDLKHYSPTHGFIRLLQDKGKLQTNYTQNIDNLEELAGIDKHRVIQCHGSFATATCRKCKFKLAGAAIFKDIRAKRVAHCARCIQNIAKEPLGPKCKKRKPTPQRSNRWNTDDDDDSSDNIPEPGVMKPDITFFGEQLPDNFFDRFTNEDVKTVDLVLVIGTSLKVAPVSEMPNYLPHDVPHIYISREAIEHVSFDVQLLGNCDDVVVELCRRAGWGLRHEMVREGVRMRVEEVEGEGCRWRVRPRKIKADAGSSTKIVSGAAKNGGDASTNGSNAATNGSNAATNGSNAATNGSDAAKTGSDAATNGSDVEKPGYDAAKSVIDVRKNGSVVAKGGSVATKVRERGPYTKELLGEK